MKLIDDDLQSARVYRRRLRTSLSSLSIVIIMYSLSGCASTRSYTPVDFCSQPVNPAMARVVLSRTSSFYGGGVGMLVFDNGQPIGDIGSGGRLCWDRFPGKAVINGRMDRPRTLEELELEKEMTVKVETRANATYHVRARLRSQWELRSGPD